MLDAAQYAKTHKYDFMMYLDADEFLILNEDTHVDSFLSKYPEAAQIGLNWLMFGSNFHEHSQGSILKS
jgi:hypothetical protein